MSETIPEILLACTLRGTLLIAIALVTGPWIRRLFGLNGAHWLWLAVLPVLFWPVPPQTPFSLRAIWPAKQSAAVVAAARDAGQSEEVEAGPLTVKVRRMNAEKPVTQPSAATEESTPANAVAETGRRAAGWADWRQWLTAIWAVGAVVCLGHLGWRWWCTLQLLREARPIHNDRVAAVLARFAKRGRVGIAVIASIRAPALAGIWRPRILIPEGWLEELSDAELESVLLHELGHHLRADLVWEWLFAIARCLHWMNPAVWMAERMARQARELACDAWALERSQFPEQYGEALLDALKRMQSAAAAASFGVAAMAADAHQIARRLEWIARGNSSPRWLAALAWMPALVALVVVGSDPVVAQTREPSISPTPAAAPVASTDESVAIRERAAAADTPLPLAKRTVEARMRILRVPETVAKKMGWPIAEDGSNGSEKFYSPEEFRGVMGTLKADPEVELLPGPRLAARSGTRGDFFALREFRYGDGYKASSSGLQVAGKTEAANLGLSVLWQPQIEDEATVRVDLTVALTRLVGFVSESGVLTKAFPPPAGTPWMQRVVSYEMPAGVAGQPSISEQKVRNQLVLNTGQVAVVFGFRDADQTPAPGASREQTMVNYFALQLEIAP